MAASATRAGGDAFLHTLSSIGFHLMMGRLALPFSVDAHRFTHHYI